MHLCVCVYNTMSEPAEVPPVHVCPGDIEPSLSWSLIQRPAGYREQAVQAIRISNINIDTVTKGKTLKNPQ